MGLLEDLEAAVGDRYRVSGQLGEGGMATVYLALDLKHHRQVAIKLLKPELSVMLGGERFLREIEIAAKLQHPHILPLFDSGEANGLLYYVMPFVEGETLRARLAREQQLSIADAVKIAVEVAGALQYAHDHGVVHRDIKPENIMLSGGHAVVADFGIARALSVAGADLTATGLSIGTPAYMSPEQAAAGAVDGRADQYSLACTLYEMLIGQPPFTGPPRAVMARHSLEPVPSLHIVRPTIPAALEGAVLRAMAKTPADRFPTVAEFAKKLGDLDSSTPAPPPRPASSVGRSRTIAVVGALVLIAAVLWWRWRLTGGDGDQRPAAAIAVLPFVDTKSSPDSAYLADGITEGLTADLAQVGALKVISRSSGAQAAEGPGKSPREIAHTLGVDAVVKGNLGRLGDSVYLEVQVYDTAGKTRWTKAYRTHLAELPSLQHEVALAVAGAIRAKVDREEHRRLATRLDVDQRAYEAYLRGRFHLERDELEPARAMFERAREIAPGWGAPSVGIAYYYAALPFASDVSPVDALPKARAALVHALELDEGLAEAHAAIAYIRAYYDWDWRAAELEYRRALALRPNYADAYFSYSRFLASRGRIDEALAQIGRASELDPLSRSLQANVALLNYFAGRYDTALAQLHATLAADSSDVTAKWGLALVEEQRGRPDEAIKILERISGASLNRKASLGHAYAVAGKTARARSVLDSLRSRATTSYVPSYYFALIHAGLGQQDQALQYLERAYQERSTVLAYVSIDPRLRSLRDHPRFVALVRNLRGE
jgi:serine/threonine-protein kinase